VSERRLHPAWILTSGIRALRGLALPLVFVFLTGGREVEWLFYALSVGITAVVGLFRLAAWWAFRYEVSGGELRVRSGIVEHRERSVPLERIQAIDVSDSPLQRLFNVVSVKIETAAGGTSGSDVTLESVSRDEAQALRALLAAYRQERAAEAPGDETPAAIMPSEAPPLRVLSTGELLLAGATSGRVGPALALLVGVLQIADDLLPRFLADHVSDIASTSYRGIATALIVVALIAWMLAVGSTVLTFNAFTLRREGPLLLISHGLLDRRRSTVPIARIQAISVTEGILRQPFGLATIRFESAGYGKDTAESGVLFPLLRRSEVPALLERACPAFAVSLDEVDLASPPRRAMRRYALARVWSVLALCAIGIAVAAVAPWVAWWWGAILLPLVAPAALYGRRCYLDAGWALDGAGRLIVRRREIDRVTTITSPRRLQLRHVSQQPLQRRARLATFRAAVASGGAGGRLEVVHLDADEAFDLVARLGPIQPAAGVAGTSSTARAASSRMPASAGSAR
jgi:putative membrane protein